MLRDCFVCKAPISQKAVACPGCGHPGQGYVNVSLSWGQIIGMVIFIPIILFVLYWLVAVLGLTALV